jgi:hypothetical protein
VSVVLLITNELARLVVTLRPEIVRVILVIFAVSMY